MDVYQIWFKQADFVIIFNSFAVDKPGIVKSTLSQSRLSMFCRHNPKTRRM